MGYLFRPVDLGSCIAWLDGNDPNGNGVPGNNNSAVTSVTDKSGSGHTFTQANTGLSPFYTNNVQNGKNGIDFGGGGTETYLDSGAFNIGANFTIFAALKARTKASNPGHFFDLASNTTPDPYAQINSTATNIVGSVWNGSADRGRITGTITASTPFIYIYQYNSSGNAAQMWINGTSAGTATNSSYSASGTTARRLGSHPTNGFYFNGIFFEIIIFNRILDNWERLRAQFELSVKWNIAVS